MSDRIDSAAGGPSAPPRWAFALFNPITRFLLAAGIPLGLNGIITIRGRKSGLPRTTPVAIIEVAGRRWVWCPWGDVQWVRNLRAAGRATITVRRQNYEVRAVELDPTQRVAFFRDTLGPLMRSVPLGVWFIRAVDGVDLSHPVAAAEGRRVFELHPL
jgi:deazaflavin-dependent oxidoreductase (nitroreductase family)